MYQRSTTTFLQSCVNRYVRQDLRNLRQMTSMDFRLAVSVRCSIARGSARSALAIQFASATAPRWKRQLMQRVFCRFDVPIAAINSDGALIGSARCSLFHHLLCLRPSRTYRFSIPTALEPVVGGYHSKLEFNHRDLALTSC